MRDPDNGMPNPRTWRMSPNGKGAAVLAVILCALSQNVGCGPVHYVQHKAGAAYPLWAGSPRTACEREEWYQLAPALVRGHGVTAGVGVFREGRTEPENLETFLPHVEEPELAQQHQARIDLFEAARRRSANWNVVSALGLFGGIASGAIVAQESPGVARGLVGTGLVVCVAAFYAAVFVKPSNSPDYAEARRRLFIPGEDDISAVGRAVNRLDARRRELCDSGTGARDDAPGSREFGGAAP